MTDNVKGFIYILRKKKKNGKNIKEIKSTCAYQDSFSKLVCKLITNPLKIFYEKRIKKILKTKFDI